MSDKERINKSKRERKNFGWLQDNTKSDDGSRENNRMMRQLTPNNIVDYSNLAFPLVACKCEHNISFIFA